jgi:hypothetical protein
MTTTVAQNKAHRADVEWIKSTGRSFDAAGEHFISEYVNPWNGMAIRKSWRMTGCDWIIFDAAGNVVGSAFSLTYAKAVAAS